MFIKTVAIDPESSFNAGAHALHVEAYDSIPALYSHHILPGVTPMYQFGSNSQASLGVYSKTKQKHTKYGHYQNQRK